MKLAILSAALLVTGLSLGGCKSDRDVSYGSIKRNLSPEMLTLSERKIDADTNVAHTNDVNGRMFWSDLGRVFHTDHPSRLSPYPILYTSGQPR